MKKNIIVFTILSVLIFFFSWGLTQTFFQQDEWNGFGTVIALSHSSFLSWFTILGGEHFIPFSQLFYALLYRLFGYQVQYFALVSLTLHSIATFLVYLCISKMSKNTLLGFVGALLFSLNVNTSEAYLHLAIFVATITCFITVLLFMLYVIYLPKKHLFSVRDSLLLSGLFLLAVGLREDGLLIIPLVLLYLLIFRRESFTVKNKNSFLLFGLVFLLFFIFRFLLQILTPHDTSVVNNGYWSTFLINIIWFAPKIFAQTILDGNYLIIAIWTHVGSLIGIPIELISVFKIFFPIAVICIDVMVFSFLGIGIWRGKSGERKLIFFGLGWTIAYSLVLSTIGRQMDLVESRYLYFPSFGIVLSFVTAGYAIYASLKNGNRYKKSAVFLFYVFSIFVFLFFSYKSIRQIIHVNIVQGNARRSILHSLKVLYPTLPKKTVLFVDCKVTCHRNTAFGISDSVVLPFSSGSGYVFLLQYAKDNENAYASFFVRQKNGVEFLWDYGSQGYREIHGFGFGYFYDKNKLLQAVKTFYITKQQVIGLEYNEDTYTLQKLTSL